jgi:predicted 3-demethylubiquinone-9 3-methyltransferase (glyoxalase superfamily)
MKPMTCLIIEDRAEEAAAFYMSLFEDARLLDVTRVGPGTRLPEGDALAVVFELDGAEFMILNHGPECAFTMAMSVMAPCRTQAEIDRLWAALAEGGEESRCGWVKDRFGVWWQVTPHDFGEILGGPPEQAGRAMRAMMGMGKLDVAAMRASRAGAVEEVR